MISYITAYENGKLIRSLLDDDADWRVCTTNTLGPMGKGIALQFAQRWQGLEDQYKSLCRAGKVKQGGDCWSFPLKSGRAILCVATKEDWHYNSKLEWIERILQTIVARYKECGIGSIALPPLGCGEGGLNWHDVGPLMARYLDPLPINVRIYVREEAYEYTYSKEWEAKQIATLQQPGVHHIYTAGYRILGTRSAIKEVMALHQLADRKIMLVDVRKSPVGQYDWRKDILINEFKDQYIHLEAAGNVNYKDPRAPHMLYNTDRAMRSLQALLQKGYSVVLLCACEHDHCHRYTVLDMLKDYLVKCLDKSEVRETHLLYQ